MPKVFQTRDGYKFSGKSAQDLVQGLSEVMSDLGNKSTNFDEEVEKKLSSWMVTKANEWEHTTNANAGAELVPVNVLTSPIDLIASSNSFLSELSVGYKGNAMNKTQKVPVTGAMEEFLLRGEATTGTLASYLVQGDTKMPTDEVLIEQKKLLTVTSLSDELSRFSIVDAYATIVNKLTKGWTEQLMDVIINGDTVTAATGNVNSDDAAPASTKAYLGFNGLRKTAIAGGATNSFDGGAITFTDLVELKKLLGINGDPNETFFITNFQTYYKLLDLAEFKDQGQNAYMSSIQSGRLLTALGSPVYVNKKFGLTEADGKQSAVTPANNVKGGILCLNKNAVQWGTNGEFEVEIVRAPGYGWNIVAGGYFGFAVADKKAGDPSPMVSLAYNLTV